MMEEPSERVVKEWLTDYRRLLADAKEQGVNDPVMAAFLYGKSELHFARHQLKSVEAQLAHARQRIATLYEHSRAEVDHQQVALYRIYELECEIRGVPAEKRFNFSEWCRT